MMKQEHISYQQVFRTFGIQPAYESSFCCLFQSGGFATPQKRRFCVYHDKESGKIRCLYINTLQYVNPDELLLLLSPYQNLQFVSMDGSNNEYQFAERVTPDFIEKWCYSIRKPDIDDNIHDDARTFLSLFDKSKDIYLDEGHHIKLILRDKSGAIADMLQYRDSDFETAFLNRFGSWDDCPDTSSLLHNLYTTHPYLIPPFFEENNQYHYHVHTVSGYHFPEFTGIFIQFASDAEVSLEPSFFLLNSLKDYVDFTGFLCHYATVKSKKNFFRHYLYTDHLVLEIIPFDSPLGHTGLTFKSWQTMLSQKLGENVPMTKWQNGTGIYTGVPLKIDILHQLCLDFIHLNKLSIRIVNRILDVDANDDPEPINDHYDEQIF